MNLRFILDELRYAIRTADADILLLQEVVGRRLDTHHFVDGVPITQFEYLADEVWPHHAYGKNAVYQRGHHGNAILSKWPLLSWDNHDVSHWWFSQRGILLGQLENGVYALCVHLGLLQREREKQIAQLQQIVQDKVPADAPLMVAGDFNDWNLDLDQRMKAMGLAEAFSDLQGKPARTFPARLPLFRMDRIYYRNMQLEHAAVLSGGHWQRLSDHRPLLASFVL